MTTRTADQVVLDTSVASLFFRNAAQADYYQHEIAGRRSIISFQTYEEALFGAVKGGWGPRRMNQLRRHLEQYELIGVTPELIDICAHLRSERESAGRGLKTADAWIAASALLLRCPLATTDGDFEGIPELEVIRAPSPPG
ncbi:MAG: type II toxin-antitoxin system VapC family toxin, partial [Acidobacteria bacterium]|nr:type II toxin-antitoxin system VapC family toxin [Acidobacteriota bacterium]